MLGLANEARLLGYGVSTCATCDGFFFRNKRIVVVGGGDSALEEALFLTKFGDSVTVVHRRKELRASKIMQDRAFRNDKITFRWDSVVIDVLGDERVTGVRVRDVNTGEESEISADGVFVAIGHAPEHGVVRRAARHGRGGLPRSATTGRRPMFLACSRAATSRTTSTGRPSQRPVRDVWPRSTQSDICRRSRTTRTIRRFS